MHLVSAEIYTSPLSPLSDVRLSDKFNGAAVAVIQEPSCCRKSIPASNDQAPVRTASIANIVESLVYLSIRVADNENP